MRNSIFVKIMVSLLFINILCAHVKNIETDKISIKFSDKILTKYNEVITINDINSNGIRKILKKGKFINAKKIFAKSSEQDTLSLNKFGKHIVQNDLSKWYTLQFDESVDITSIIDSLKVEKGINKISKVYRSYAFMEVNDQYFYKQKGLYNSLDHDIDIKEAWDIETGNGNVKFGIVDTGIEYNHPDLDPGDRSRIIYGRDLGSNDYDAIDDLSPTPLPGFDYSVRGHGTGVAGIIGAIVDNKGIAGIMWDCSIMPLKVFHSSNNAFCLDIDVAAAINYATSQGVDVFDVRVKWTV